MVNANPENEEEKNLLPSINATHKLTKADGPAALGF